MLLDFCDDFCTIQGSNHGYEYHRHLHQIRQWRLHLLDFQHFHHGWWLNDNSDLDFGDTSKKKKRYCQYIFQIFFFRNVLVNVLRASSILLNAREIYLQEWGIRLLIISMIRSRYRCSLVFQSRHLSLAYFGLKARFGWSSANGWYHRCTFWRHNGNHHWVLRRWKNKWDIRIHLKQVDVKKFREIENVGYKLQIENQN